MFTFFLVLLVLDSIVLVTAILMQAGKGGGLSAAFGGAGSSSDSFLGTRQMGNVLTKVTWWAGGLFLALGFTLSIMSSRAAVPRTLFDDPIPTAPGMPAVPFEQQQPLQQPAPAPTTPAPTTPAPTTPTP
jgi:preprotein translocase subunit SecG